MMYILWDRNQCLHYGTQQTQLCLSSSPYLFHFYAQITFPWWRHQMETFSTLLVICAGNSPGTGEFPTQRPVTRSFDVFHDPRLTKRLSKQPWGWWFETLSRPLWRQRNDWCRWGGTIDTKMRKTVTPLVVQEVGKMTTSCAEWRKCRQNDDISGEAGERNNKCARFLFILDNLYHLLTSAIFATMPLHRWILHTM